MNKSIAPCASTFSFDLPFNGADLNFFCAIMFLFSVVLREHMGNSSISK